MSPHINILLPLGGTLLGLGMALALVRVRALSVAGYSRQSYRAIEGLDLKTGLLLTMVAMLAAAAIPLVSAMMAPEPEADTHIKIPGDVYKGPIVFPQPPPIDRNKAGNLADLSAFTKAPTLGVPKPVEDHLVAPEDDLTSSQAVDLYGMQHATPDSVIRQLAQAGQDDLPSPEDFVSYDRHPQALALPKPVYPEFCVGARIEGTAYVQILLNKKGEVVQVRIHRSSGNDALDEAALAAARGARFTPAYQGDTPVSVWVSLPFAFRVRN